MKYFLAVIGNEANWEAWTPEEREDAYKRMGVFNDEMTRAGVMLDGAGLQPLANARTVRWGGGGPVVSDGPFAEAKEQLAGYWVIECASLDEALDWASRAPMAEGAVVEVRPLEEM